MLKEGKIPENILKRSVLRRFKNKRDEVCRGPEIAGDCALIRPKEGKLISITIDPVVIGSPAEAGRAVYAALNDIYAAKADPIGAAVSVLLPEGIEEVCLKEISDNIEAACKRAEVRVIGGHTEITGAVRSPIITVTGIGQADDSDDAIGKAFPGDDIVITKWIGLEASAIIAGEDKNNLLGRFSPGFIKRAADFKEQLLCNKEADILKGMVIHRMHNLSYGGIYAALWETAEASGTGLKVNLMDIPIRQETVEICEEYGLNPYEIVSGGSMLIAAPGGHDIVRLLKENGINAAVIGKITDGNDRIVINGDETRFLNIPKSDEIYKYRQMGI